MASNKLQQPQNKIKEQENDLQRLAIINLELNQKNKEMKGIIKSLVDHIRQREFKYKANNFKGLDLDFMVGDDAKYLV